MTDLPGASAGGFTSPTLRLAVFGHVKDGGGSVSSAHFQLCRALVDAGHQLDLFGRAGFVPDPGFESPHFRYVPVLVNARFELDLRYLPRYLRVFVHRMAGRSRTMRYRHRAMLAADARHSDDPYDALLFLGIAPGRLTIAGIPTVVWPQGAPQNELTAVRGLAEPVSRVASRSTYLKMRLYYEIKDRLVWRWARRHRLILGSNIARQRAIAYGVPADRVCVAPYPVDLTRFTQHAIPRGAVRNVLCFGRLDPRKRVDLLVDAVGILAQRRDDFHVDIVGKDGSVPGWSRFVQEAGRDLPMTYVDAVPQAEILERLCEADVVVQPSEHEEFGSAIAEALACGIPVVTGPTNGTSEYTPTTGSVTFDRYEPHSLAHAIDRALSISREPCARSACRAAAHIFSADRVAATVADFIRQTSS